MKKKINVKDIPRHSHTHCEKKKESEKVIKLHNCTNKLVGVRASNITEISTKDIHVHIHIQIYIVLWLVIFPLIFAEV